MGSLQSLVFPNQPSNMKSMILFAVFLAVAAAAPAPPGRETHHPHPQAIPEPRHRETRYSFSYETENGISVSESGVQKQIGDKPEEAGTVSKGQFSYPEG